MVKELTRKEALEEWYKKPFNEITKEEKHQFKSMTNPFYDAYHNYDLNEEEKDQVLSLIK